MTKTSRVILTSIVAVLMLIAVIAAGLNAVFTVTLVRAEFALCSAEGQKEAKELQEELDTFVGKSTTFLDLEDMEALVSAYPCFRLEGIRKKFPKTVELQITERKELFAFELAEGGYAILDEEGIYLYSRSESENVNRADGAPNLVVSYVKIVGSDRMEIPVFPFEGQLGERANATYFDELFTVFRVFGEKLSSVRANILSVKIEQRGSDPRNDFLCMEMREGVRIEIGNPSYRVEDKARAAIGKYLSLDDVQMVSGVVQAIDYTDGEEVGAEWVAK